MPIIVVTLFSHFSLFFFLQSRYLYFNLSLKQRRFCLCRHQAHDQSNPMSLLLWIFFSLISCLSLMTPELIYNLFHLFFKVLSLVILSPLSPLWTYTLFPATFQFSFPASFFYLRWPCLTYLLLFTTTYDQRSYHCHFMGTQTLKAMIRMPGIMYE